MISNWHKHACTRSLSLTHTNTHMYSHAHTRMHARTHTHTHTHTRTHARTCTHTRTHARARTRTHSWRMRGSVSYTSWWWVEGPTGVEFAAEVHDFLREDVARMYPYVLEDARVGNKWIDYMVTWCSAYNSPVSIMS